MSGQPFLFDVAEIPEIAPEKPALSLYVHFEAGDLIHWIRDFGRRLGQNGFSTSTRIVRFPQVDLFPEKSEDALKAVPPEVPDRRAATAEEERKLDIFGKGEWWEDHWRSMPEFVQGNLAPAHTIQVDIYGAENIAEFERRMEQKVPEFAKRTPSIWHPEAEIGHFYNKRYVSTSPVGPRYPVYIISKGRWESRLTAKALEKLGVPYSICVEPQEYEEYAKVIDPSRVLVLPFSNIGAGSIPARNWVWEHALSIGAERHWILDDNIDGFFRLNRNLKTPIADGTIFRCAEDFVDRYENVAIAGFHYFMFASRKTKLPPFTLNSRVYSMILIRNDLRWKAGGPMRWRGRYNEDTDLSLRALKDGWCTVLFTAFLGLKSTTMSMKGGNTDHLYAGTGSVEDPWERHQESCLKCSEDSGKLCDHGREILSKDGRWLMADSLRDQHPALTKITRKWGRWQHDVDYSSFKQQLIQKPGVDDLPPEVNNYGMYLQVDPE